MTVTFFGTGPEFQRLVESLGRGVRWGHVGNNVVRCDLDNGVVVHYWWKTGSVLFQGPVGLASSAENTFARGVRELRRKRRPPVSL
jgi:hypothetical protein